MINYSFLLLFVFCVYSPVFSQINANNKSKIVFQVDSLNEITEKIRRINTDSALVITEKSEKLATSISYELGRGIALKNKSLIIFSKGNYTEALKIVEKSISVLEKTPNKIDLASAYGLKGHLKEQSGDANEALENYTKSINALKSVTNLDVSLKLAISYNLLGIHYQRKSNHVEALKHFNEALLLVENLNEPRFESAFLSNIGNTHLYQQEYQKAIPYYEKTIAIQKQEKDKSGLSISYTNLGAAFLGQDKNKEALPYLQEASQIYKEVGNTRGYLLNQMNIGITYYNINQYDEAIKYYRECLELEKEITDKTTLTMIYNNLAATNNKKQNYDSAIVFAQKGLEIAKAIDAKRDVINNLESIAVSYEGKKDFENAYKYHLLYKASKDSLFNIEKSSEINALLLEQKKSENIQLEKDNLIKENELQKERFETQAQKQTVLILEKQAEADHLLALAKESKNKQEADSLFRAAKTAQLEADNLKIKAENLNVKAQKAEAEKRADQAENEREISFQRNLSWLFGIGILGTLLIIYISYQNQKNKQKANLLLAEKNEEINLQNELLEKSNTMKDKLFAIIAHDLRSPITAFQTTVKQINFFLRKDQPERLKEISNQIENSSQSLSNLLNNLLNWALTQQENAIKINKQQLSIAQNIEEVQKIYQHIAIANQIELQTDIQKDTFGYVDKDCFQTILRNLIANALKYTPEGGKIVVSATAQQNTVLLKISDTGIGMSEEFKEKLFQLHVTTTNRGIRGEKGTGLGLVLCYEFAALNDIKIEVESKEGKGTVFLLTIPTV